MADFNELARQAIPLSEQFAKQLGEALDLIEQIHKDADRAQEKAESKTGDVKEAIDALETFFESAQNAIEDARESAETNLGGLERRATALKTRLEALSAAVKKGADDVEAKKVEVEKAIQDQLEAARTDFQGRGQELLDLQSTLQQNLTQAHTALNVFRNTIAEAQKQLDDKMGEWQAAVDKLTGAAAHEADEWVDELEELMETAVSAMFNSGNTMIAVHNMAMDSVKSLFITEAAQDLETSMEPVEKELQRLSDLATTRQTELPAKAKEIVEKIKGVVAQIETVKTLMQSADQL